MKPAAVALCGLLALVACGDGSEEPLTFEEYGPSVAAVFTETRDTLQRLGDEAEQAEYETDEELLEADRRLLRDFGDAFSSAADRLGGLTPPEDAEEAHDAFRDASRRAADAFDAFADVLDSDDNADESEAVGDSLSQFEATCAVLRTVIAESGPAVDISCVLGGD